MSFEGWNLSTWGRWLPGRRSSDPEAASGGSPGGAPSLGDSLATVRREREIHVLLVAEMERLGPEVTADDLYERIAAQWDRDHPAAAPPETSQPAPATSRTPSGQGVTPGWAAELLEEQRETNRLLGRLLERLGERGSE